jgi:hypothetical protein
MFTEEQIAHIKKLYSKIFDEDAGDSKEFTIFVNGNPHPLRVKVEIWLSDMDSIEVLYNLDTNTERNIFINKVIAAQELDTFITDYIENNYV